MRPYVRSLMQQAHENGTPVMRTMFYEFPDDPVCWELKDQYMFGSDLLVAPVVYKDAEEREVYLPAGEKLDRTAYRKSLSGRSDNPSQCTAGSHPSIRQR